MVKMVPVYTRPVDLCVVSCAVWNEGVIGVRGDEKGIC